MEPTKPIAVYRRRLPHWRQEGATYFLTFRLADSVPDSKMQELKAEREAWLSRNPNPSDQEIQNFHRKVQTSIERWLDLGHGRCALGSPVARTIVEDTLKHFAGTRYVIRALVVMPNHVHAVILPLPGFGLERIIQSWKRHSASEINRLFGSKGQSFWQDEYFDRIVRDTPHLRRVIRYIEKNPRGVAAAGAFWLTPEWHDWYYGPSR